MIIEGHDIPGLCDKIARHLRDDCGLKTNASTIYRWKDKENWDLEVKLAVQDRIEGSINEDLKQMYKSSVDLFFLSARKLEEVTDMLSAKDHIAILKTCAETITRIAGIEEKQSHEIKGSIDTNHKIVIEKCYAGVPPEKEDEE
jgi:hypothetical protein